MAGGFPLGFGRTVLARVMRRLSGGSARDRFARQPAPRGRWFLRFVEEPDLFSLHENLWPGDAPGPPNDIRAPCQPARGCPGSASCPKRARSAGAGSPVRLRARAIRPPPAVGHRGRAHTRFLGSIIHREDVEFLCRRSETGGTPTPPGVEFVRYRRFCGLGFRQTTPQTPRIAVRVGFRA